MQAFFVPEPEPTKAESESARLLEEMARVEVGEDQPHQQFAFPDKSQRGDWIKSLCYALPNPDEVAQDA